MKKTHVTVSPAAIGTTRVTVHTPWSSLGVSSFVTDEMLFHNTYDPQAAIKHIARRLAGELAAAFEKEILEELQHVLPIHFGFKPQGLESPYDGLQTEKIKSIYLNTLGDHSSPGGLFYNEDHSNVAATQKLDLFDQLAKLIPGIDEMITACPACLGVEQPLPRTITHLNDYHQLTREEIADWLDSLEFDLIIGKKE